MRVLSLKKAVPGRLMRRRSGWEGRGEQIWLLRVAETEVSLRERVENSRRRLTGFGAQQINLALDDLNPRLVARYIFSSVRGRCFRRRHSRWSSSSESVEVDSETQVRQKG